MAETEPRPDISVVRSAVVDGYDRILLVRRNLECLNNPGAWELPGGQIEPDEDEAEATIREVRQETGLGIVLTSQFVVAERRHRREAGRAGWYVVRCAAGQPVEGDLGLGNEIIDAGWFTYQAALEQPGLTIASRNGLGLLGQRDLQHINLVGK